jgi:acetyl-CoA carboxylase biotin carboxylase subunit
VFVANRGEVAVRVIRACKALGLESVLGVSEADRESMGARLADRTVCIGPAPASQSYLRAELLITAAKGTGCQALHPGYGFLSERAQFQRMCIDAGLTFVGPSAEAIEAMGDKLSAIRIARRIGVPTVPGSDELRTEEEVRAAAAAIGYPCLLKASAGGGGRGMRVLRSADEPGAALASAAAEAQAAFGDATVYLEKFIERAKHIEIQVLGDLHGNLIHLFERDCSVQRRHQKLIEEAPCTVLAPGLRAQMAQAALALAHEVGYSSAGTVEFVLDADAGRFYFLEMNTRVQVEHPVTEMIAAIDIVQEQLRVAASERLSFRQGDVTLRGHAIECRINAEDPARGFAPSPGRVTRWRPPAGPGVRLDTHCSEGYLVPPYYDSMIGKLIVWGENRAQSAERMASALASFAVEGVKTTIPFHRDVLRHRDFREARITTRWVENDFLRSWPHAADTGALLPA